MFFRKEIFGEGCAMTFEELKKGVSLLGCTLTRDSEKVTFSFPQFSVSVIFGSDASQVAFMIVLVKDWIKLLGECMPSENKSNL
jgi:hypothetical protein